MRNGFSENNEEEIQRILSKNGTPVASHHYLYTILGDWKRGNVGSIRLVDHRWVRSNWN